MSTDQWHYTDKTGSQAGPISTEELKQLLASGNILSTSMVWKAGMPSWSPINQVQEFQAPPAPATPAAPVKAPAPPAQPNKPTTPSVDPYEDPRMPDEDTYVDIDAGSYGGIGRGAYFLYSILLSLAVEGVKMLLLKNNVEPNLVDAVPLLSLIVSFWLMFARFKNIRMSRWWTLGLFVPILNIFVSIWMLSRQEGWSETRELDSTGKVIAWILWILNILLIVAVIASISYIGLPNILEAIKNAQHPH